MAAITTILKLKSLIVAISVLISSNFIPMIDSRHNWPIMTHLQFYFHDQVSGKHPTVARIVASNVSTSTFFGNVVMIDDLLTESASPKSTALGRAQGLYAGAGLEKGALLMVMNFVFTDESAYNGSTLAMLGRNEFGSKVREMPIVGGTGDFRYAQGFAQATTIRFNPKNGDAVVQYNVTVLHYTSN